MNLLTALHNRVHKCASLFLMVAGFLITEKYFAFIYAYKRLALTLMYTVSLIQIFIYFLYVCTL